MIDWTEERLERYPAEDPGGPVVLLNQLRFRPEGGRDSYLKYSEHMAVLREKYQTQVIYAGDGATPLVAEEGQDWDFVALVRYPDRLTFASMVRDRLYREGAHLRHDALMESVLQATLPLTSV